MVIYKTLYYIITKTYIFCIIWDIFGIDPVTTRFDLDFAFGGGAGRFSILRGGGPWGGLRFWGGAGTPDETMDW